MNKKSTSRLGFLSLPALISLLVCLGGVLAVAFGTANAFNATGAGFGLRERPAAISALRSAKTTGRTFMRVTPKGVVQVRDLGDSARQGAAPAVRKPSGQGRTLVSPEGNTVWSVDDDVSIAESVAIDNIDVWGAWRLNGSHLNAYPIAGDGTPAFTFPAHHVDGFTGVTAAKGADRALFLDRDLFTGDENIHVYAFTSQSNGTPDWSFEFPTLVGSAPSFRSIAVSYDGSTAAAVGFREVEGEESTLYVFNADTGDIISTWTDPSRMQAVDLTDDGSIALVSQDAQATLIETATGQVLFQTPGSGGNSVNFRISGDGNVFVVGGLAFDVYKFDGTTYQQIIHLTRPNAWFGQASVVSRDGSTVGTFAGDFGTNWLTGEVFLFDVATGQMLGSHPVSGSGDFQGTPVDAESSDDGTVMAFASWGTENNDWPEIMVFNRNVELITQIDFPGSAFAVDVSPDGRYVVGGAKATHANEFETGGRIELIQLEGPTPTPTPLPCATNPYVITQGTDPIVPGDTDIGNHCDDCFTTVALPFSFQLYDQTFNAVHVSSNGRLDFVTINEPGGGVTSCLPAPPSIFGPFDYTIFGLWVDLVTNDQPGCANFPGGSCGIFTSVSGAAPNRVFNIEWRGVLFFDIDREATRNFEVRLYENDPNKRFDIIYGDISTVGPVQEYVAGVQGPDSLFTQDFCGSTFPLNVSRTYTQPWGRLRQARLLRQPQHPLLRQQRLRLPPEHQGRRRHLDAVPYRGHVQRQHRVLRLRAEM